MKRALQTLAGLGISAAALAFTLRGKDLGRIWSEMLGADYRWLWPYLGIMLLIHLVRTVRWGILLEPVAKVPFARLNAAAAVGFMALMVLPFRLGEFAVFSCFAFHAFNGMRLVFVELGFAVGRPIEPVFPYQTSLSKQRPLFIVMMLFAAALFFMGGYELVHYLSK